MDSTLLIIMMLLLALFIISLPILLGYLFYRVIKRYINLKFAIIFVSLYGLFLISVVLSQIYEDELFFKSDAIELVEDLNFGLNDDFKIIENDEFYLREYFQPNGENYSPTKRRISISKISGELVFEGNYD